MPFSRRGWPATLPRVPDHADLTRRLADLVVGYGANVQPGQIVGVTTYVGKEALTREVTRAAYERGARWVDVSISDPWLKRERLLHADESTLDYVPPWMIERLEWLSDEHAARISLNGPASPDALDGIDAVTRGPRHSSVPPEHGRGRQPGDDELVRRPGALAGLGLARLSRARAGRGVRSTLGGDRAHLPARRG